MCVGIHCAWVAQGLWCPVAPSPMRGSLRRPDRSAQGSLGIGASGSVNTGAGHYPIPSHPPSVLQGCMGMVCGGTRACNVCLVVLWCGSQGQEQWSVGATCTYGVQQLDRAAPLQGGTLNSWFAVEECVCVGGGGDAIFKRKACMGPGVSAQWRGPVPKRMSDVKPS